MASKYMTSSGAVGASGDYNMASRILVNGVDPGATDPGTVLLKQGGSSGTTVLTIKIAFGSSDQFTLPNLVFDYVTLTDASCLIEYFKQHGKA